MAPHTTQAMDISQFKELLKELVIENNNKHQSLWRDFMHISIYFVLNPRDFYREKCEENDTRYAQTAQPEAPAALQKRPCHPSRIKPSHGEGHGAPCK